MKKIIFTLFCCILLISSCTEKKTPKISFDEDTINIYVFDTYELKPIVEDYEHDNVFLIETKNDGIISYDGLTIKGLKKGTTEIKVSLKYTEASTCVKITVLDRFIKIKGENTAYVGENHTFTYESENVDTTKILWSVDDSTIASIDNAGKVIFKKAGIVNIKASSGNIINTFKVTVKEDEKIEIDNEISTIYLGKTHQLKLSSTYNGTPVKYESSDSSICEITAEGLIKPIKEGKVKIKVSNKTSEKTIDLEIKKDQEAPKFVFSDNFKKDLTINYNEDFNYLDGISAIDNIDQDITANITHTNNLNSQKCGKYTIKYTVKDSSGNEASFERNITVKYDYDVTFIGHAGCFYGIMNSEEAFLYAVQVLQYQALECDLKQTKDGVFILSHDDTFGDYKLNETTWDVLKDVTVTKTRNSGVPSTNGSVVKDEYTTKLCTLDRYLDICKEYDVIPVIELKASAGITQSDQSRMQALMDQINAKGMLEKTILLGSQYNCLIWTRNKGYDFINCQYLVASCESETILNRCIDNNLNLSINVTSTYSNSDEWLAQYFERNIEVSTYTFSQYVDYNVLQKWIDKGVDYVTCDWQLMSELRLPKRNTPPKKTYTVNFFNKDMQVIKSVQVEEGKAVASPLNMYVHGYTFVKWDKELTNITKDLNIYPVYELCNYTITYVLNNKTLTPITINTKAEFANIFYTDLLKWFTDNYQTIGGITLKDKTFTLTRNGTKVSFTTVEDLKDINIYTYEKTIGLVLMKPFTRTDDFVIEVDEHYFFNSSTYKDKYQNVDKWLLNCINKTYTSYNKGYNPTSQKKVQIFFRLQQWMQGTNIAAFDDIPVLYDVTNSDSNITLPKVTTFTIEDEVILENISGTKEFAGWYMDKELTIKVEKIEKGTAENITLYAKWI